MNITCEVVRDMAELYKADLLENEESIRQIRSHLKTCPSCRAYYKAYDRHTTEQNRKPQPPCTDDMDEMQKRMYATLAKKMNQHRIMEIIGTSAAIGAGSIMLIIGLVMTSNSLHKNRNKGVESS
ncbi:MAG: zf-HC2 domain-containing protein [Oscillospiraceae bacterium]